MILVSVTYRISAILLLLLLGSPLFAALDQKVEQDKIEAAMALRLLGFVEWPEVAGRDVDNEIVVGVFEDDGLRVEFEELAIGSRFRIVFVDGDSPLEVISSLDAVFIDGEERASVGRLFTRLEGAPVVRIGSFDGFLEMGGMVNFVRRQKRVTFEIDLDHSRDAGIAYRAKLLRLANRVEGR